MASLSILTLKVRIAFIVNAMNQLEKQIADVPYEYEDLENRRLAKIASIERMSDKVENLIDQAMQQGAPDREWWNWR